MTSDWTRSAETSLARYVTATAAKHLRTYADPNRLKEDVRHETAVLEAAYRHRQVIELIQNGADALRDHDGGGRIEVVLAERAIYVANEGVPLTEDGLTGLLYVGLSEKKGKEIGRLGVGFKSVLEITSTPKFLSRSVSLSFDERRSRQRIEQVVGPVEHAVPVMRLAEVIDPYDIARDDEVVHEMMQWASSIVVLPLDRGRPEWLPETLTQQHFRQEFLLFSPQVTDLVLDDRWNNRIRRIGCHRDGATLVLTESGSEASPPPTEWQVRTQTVELSDEARADGGERFGRSSVDLAWAVPQATEEATKYRELWAFFPIPGVTSSLPGILNTAWKLSEDRGNLVEGPLNEELLEAAAALVLNHLTSHAPSNRPGFVLDLLPPIPPQWGQRSGAGWASRLLQEMIWELAPSAAIVPSESGEWHLSSELKLWPQWINKPGLGDVVSRWRGAIAKPEEWVHRSVMTETRVPRAQHLKVRGASSLEWIEAMRSEDAALTSSVNAVELVAEVLDHEAVRSSRQGLTEARIVRTESGSWISIADARMDESAPPDEAPARGLRQLVREIHKRLGISSSVEERSLVELATPPMDAATAEAFWTSVHELGTPRAIEALRGLDSLSHVLVRTAGGAFVPNERALMPGRIVGPDDAEHAVDVRFHEGDRELLTRIGVSDVPGFRAGASSADRFHREYLREHENQWRSLQQEHVGSTPDYGRAVVRPTEGEPRFPNSVELMSQLEQIARHRWTRWALTDAGWDIPWRVDHATQRKYKTLQIPSPLAWAIQRYGVLDTSQGPVVATSSVSPNLAHFRKYLAVAENLTSDGAEALGLPSSLESLPDRLVADAFQLAASLADSVLDTSPVSFLRELAEAGWRPGFDLGSPALTDRLNEAEEARAGGTRVWISRTQDKDDWPAGWEFSRIERPPATAAGEIDVFSLVELFPTVAERLEDGPTVSVWLCDKVIQGDATIDFARDVDVLLLSRATGQEARLEWVVNELLGTIDPAVRQDAVDAALRLRDDGLLQSVRSADSDRTRLVALLGPERLARAVAQLLPSQEYGPPDAQAAALLTTFGPSTLREVRHLLPQSLGVPTQWAGGDLALRFVRNLGFSDEFAGRRKAERPDEERVLGPTVAGELHDFQKEISQRLQALLDERARGVVDLPTGAGKTRVAIESILEHARREGRLGLVLWMAEREELCEQAVTQWLQLWRSKGLIDQELRVSRCWGGRNVEQAFEGDAQVVVASRQQLHRRLRDTRLAWLQGAELLVIDEAHHSTAGTYLEILRWLGGDAGSYPSVLGLSATPFRSDATRTDHLARLFGRSLVGGEMMGPTWRERIRWLQQKGYLSHVDLRDLQRGVVLPTTQEAEALSAEPNLTTGLDLLNQRLGADEGRNHQLVEVIEELDDEWPVIVFAGSVTHAQRLATMLSERGISARPVWGELAPWARRDAIEAFRDRRVRVLTNFNVLSEGFDAPQTRAVIIARLVQSDGLFLQMLGRGMRGPENGGTERCQLITTGERLPDRFDKDGQLDIERFEYLWAADDERRGQ